MAEAEDGEEVAADGRKRDGDLGSELGDRETAGGGAAGFERGVAGVGGVEFERDGGVCGAACSGGGRGGGGRVLGGGRAGGVGAPSPITEGIP